MIFQDSDKVIKIMEHKKGPQVSEKKSLFEWTNDILVECLKIELIHDEIISKMEGYKMLDFEER